MHVATETFQKLADELAEEIKDEEGLSRRFVLY